MTSTSLHLQETIEQAYESMIYHPRFALAHIHRRSIYQQLQLPEVKHGQLARKWLAIITARRVLPVWQHTRPHDNLAIHVLTIAERVCNQEIQIEIAQEEAGKYWEELEQLGNGAIRPYHGFFAGQACIQALFEVLGRDPFEGIELLPDEFKHSDLDPWCSDTAIWAEVALTDPGPFVDSDDFKRKEFWTWWLKDAIPMALQISSQR
jgi:hypothetical protein